MNAIELKRELHSFIDQEDDRTLEMLGSRKKYGEKS